MFLCCNDVAAKSQTVDLAKQLGWNVEDDWMHAFAVLRP